MFMKPILSALLVGTMLSAVAATNSIAQSSAKPGKLTGIDNIHAQTRVGGKVCMSDHEHVGEGNLTSRKGAEAAAVRAWQDFTAFEYGSAWGKYTLAVGKTMNCASTSGRWTCNVTARPCRPGSV